MIANITSYITHKDKLLVKNAAYRQWALYPLPIFNSFYFCLQSLYIEFAVQLSSAQNQLMAIKQIP